MPMSRKADQSLSEAISPAEVLAKAGTQRARQLGWRRHLHQYPELSNEEHRTTRYLRNEVTRFGLKVIPTKTRTGLLAELVGAGRGPTIAIRTDIDALPVTEHTGLSFASKHTGRMHACGHDMHMATVLGTARLLASMEERLRGRVRFIFQPAEEHPPGGALPMIAGGALNGVSAILGLHVDPEVPVGKIGLRDGAAMASVYDFDLHVHGRGGHAARPHLSVDSIVTAAEIIESLQKVASREVDPVDPIVITFGQIHGGTARNVIADRVQLVGTARTLSARAEKQVPHLIKRTVEHIARARGARCTISPIARYPVLENTPWVNAILASCCIQLFGKGRVIESQPVLGGEDFACYLQRVPGAMFRLGIMNKQIGADQPWHSSRFKCDENALVYGSALLALSAVHLLERTA